MRQTTRCLRAIGFGGLLWVRAVAAFSGQPPEGASPAEAERIWQALVEALALGDRAGVVRLTHSARRHLVADPLPPLPADEAHQLGFCRPLPGPLPSRENEVIYRVRCEARGERAETNLILRRDLDGVWRVIP
jgi:hypothetical protein